MPRITLLLLKITTPPVVFPPGHLVPQHKLQTQGYNQSSTTSHSAKMPMTLKGSCQCGTVQFTLQSSSPVPFMFCACSICRKLGAYGYACQLGAQSSSLDITSGSSAIKTYHAIKRSNPDPQTPEAIPSEQVCSSHRRFCSECGTMLWLWDPTWPELIHPFSSAIDTELPSPPEGEAVGIMKDSKPAWVSWPKCVGKVFEEYPEESLEAWHKRTGCWVE